MKEKQKRNARTESVLETVDLVGTVLVGLTLVTYLFGLTVALSTDVRNRRSTNNHKK